MTKCPVGYCLTAAYSSGMTLTKFEAARKELPVMLMAIKGKQLPMYLQRSIMRCITLFPLIKLKCTVLEVTWTH